MEFLYLLKKLVTCKKQMYELADVYVFDSIFI